MERRDALKGLGGAVLGAGLSSADAAELRGERQGPQRRGPAGIQMVPGVGEVGNPPVTGPLAAVQFWHGNSPIETGQ